MAVVAVTMLVRVVAADTVCVEVTVVATELQFADVNATHETPLGYPRKGLVPFDIG